MNVASHEINPDSSRPRRKGKKHEDHDLAGIARDPNAKKYEDHINEAIRLDENNAKKREERAKIFNLKKELGLGRVNVEERAAKESREQAAIHAEDQTKLEELKERFGLSKKTAEPNVQESTENTSHLTVDQILGANASGSLSDIEIITPADRNIFDQAWQKASSQVEEEDAQTSFFGKLKRMFSKPSQIEKTFDILENRRIELDGGHAGEMARKILDQREKEYPELER